MNANFWIMQWYGYNSYSPKKQWYVVDKQKCRHQTKQTYMKKIIREACLCFMNCRKIYIN